MALNWQSFGMIIAPILSLDHQPIVCLLHRIHRKLKDGFEFDMPFIEGPLYTGTGWPSIRKIIPRLTEEGPSNHPSIRQPSLQSTMKTADVVKAAQGYG